MRSFILLLWVLATAFGASAQTTGASVPLSSTTPPPMLDYHLHLSDSLEIQFPFSSEYNETTTVQPDGRITLREAGAVQVVGLTVSDAEAAITRAYTGILKDPKVSILLKDFLKPSFYASGEVGKPGRYELRSEVTLLQALSEAGGMLNERARKTQVVVFRYHGDGTYESKVIDMKDMLKSKGPREDFPILPGDVIYVPQNRMSKIQRYIPTASLGAYLAPI
jgi:polysaccharide export outer membrane protein